MSKRLRVWMMAGGTGGHIVPGLAVAQALRDDGCEVLWLGNVDRMEGRLVPPAGFPMINIGFAGVRGKGLLHKLRTPFSLAWWVLRVLLHMLRRRPIAVIGMGGYVSVPGGLSAWLLRVPLVLHEQNAIAGMSNRYLAKFAARVLTGFPDTLPDATWTGNPVRETFLNAPSPETRYGEREGALRVLVVGGSLGAAALNEVVPQAVAQLAPDVRPEITHQSGEAHLTQLQKNYDDAGVRAECVAFIDDMADAMAQADLLVCRAGAMTVAEVAAMGVAALFVPFPFAVDDHQTANAAWLVDNDAAFLQQQSSLSVEWLAQWLGEQTRETLRDVAQRAHAFAKPDATRDIAQACLQSARRAS